MKRNDGNINIVSNISEILEEVLKGDECITFNVTNFKLNSNSFEINLQFNNN